MRRFFCSLTAASLMLSLGIAINFAQDAEKKEEKPAAAKAEDKPAEKKEDKPAEKKEDKPADKPADAAAGPTTKTSVVHLDTPSGVCVHPTTGHVFITSRQGVFRFVPGKPGKIYLEVEGFPTDIYGKGPMYNIGPLGCTLWGADRLIVPDGSRKAFIPYPTPLFDDDGTMTGAVNLLVDVSAQQADALTEQACRCRRLSNGLNDRDTAHLLDALAEGFARNAEALRG